MKTFNHIVFTISTIIVLANLSLAWTNAAISVRQHPTLLQNTALKATPSPTSTALNYQSGDYQQEQYTSNTIINDELDTELRLQVALQAARDADRRHGLCTEPSIKAWQVVDDIYSSSIASKQVEDNLHQVLGEKSIWCSFERR